MVISIIYLIFNFLERITKSATLRKIKSEYQNKERQSADVYHDAKITKMLTQDEYNHAKSNFVRGYVQSIGCVPYSLILFSAIQVFILVKSIFLIVILI